LISQECKYEKDLTPVPRRDKTGKGPDSSPHSAIFINEKGHLEIFKTEFCNPARARGAGFRSIANGCFLMSRKERGNHTTLPGRCAHPDIFGQSFRVFHRSKVAADAFKPSASSCFDILILVISVTFM